MIKKPKQIGEINPSLRKEGQYDFLHHNGKATIFRQGSKFQAVYESEKLNIAGETRSDLVPAIEMLEYLIEQIRNIADTEIQSMLPDLK